MTSKLSRVMITLAAIVLFAAGASAMITQVGIMANGPVFVSAENNGYLYVGQGGEIHVFDVATKDKILNLNWSSRIAKFHEPTHLGNRIQAINITGNRLYGTDDTSFFIADVTDPSNPVELSRISVPSNYMVMSGNGQYAYSLASGNISVVDVSNTATLIRKVPLPSYPWRATVSGKYLYVTFNSASVPLMIYDISDPANPALVTTYRSKNTGGYSGISIRGNYAYAVNYYRSLAVIDITDVLNPVPITNVTGGYMNDIRIQGNYAYISTRYGGFNIFDLSNAALPTRVGSGASEVGGYTEGIFVKGNYVYLSVESMGEEIYDVSIKEQPARLMHVYTIGGADSIAVSGDTVYVGGHNDGIWVVDASDKSNLKETGFVYTAGRNTALEVDGDKLYYAGVWSGIGMADVSNPADPKVVWDHMGSNQGYLVMSKDKKYLYAPSSIIDVTDPASPHFETTTPPWSGGRVYTTFGDRYVISIKSGAWQVVDVSNPANPVLVSIFEPNRTSYADLAVYNNMAVGAVNNLVVVYDLSNPATPQLLKKKDYTGSWTPGSVVIVGNKAYISGSGLAPTLRVFDLTNTADIPMVDSGSDGVTYYDGLYLYGTSKFGIAIYLPPGVVIPTPTPSPTPTPTMTTFPTTLPTTEPTATETIKPTPIPTDPICPQPKRICIEITETNMRLIPCPG